MIVMTGGRDGLRGARSILLIDWPSREVPESLAREGYRVTAKGGPADGDYSVYEVVNRQLRARPVERRSDHV